MGPTDSGKTTLAKILLSYGARKGEGKYQIMFVDLDVGQGLHLFLFLLSTKDSNVKAGTITVPGQLACIPVDTPLAIGVML